MKILGFEIGSKKPLINKTQQKQSVSASSFGRWGNAYSVSFDGEKSLGELGPVIKYELDYNKLRLRSWQSLLENDLSKTIFNKYTNWIIGSGLKLQCTPQKEVLQAEGINIDESFNRIIEARFSVFSKSKKSSYSGEISLNELSKEAFKNARVGGDVLVIARYDKKLKSVTFQLIDGEQVSTPFNENSFNNKIKNGIEIDEKGTHIAYHIKKDNLNWERVTAYDEKTGLRMAFMVYGNKYRIANVRGIPAIATSLETLKKIERYKEAAVGSAEERQKIAFFIEHNQFSNGESPLSSQMASLFDADLSDENSDIPKDSNGEALARTIAATSNKNTYNLTQGSTIKQLESKNELYFKDFYGTNAEIICSSIGIPPNVAFSVYNDSFSASRTATKDWEHTMDVERSDWQEQFYNPIFSIWLHVEVLNNRINIPGYLESFLNGNWIVLEALTSCRFTGAMFPHIDPLKEVKAEREKLGVLGANIPLTTVEQATESLFSGNSDSNMEQFSEELKKSIQLGLVDQTKSINPVQ